MTKEQNLGRVVAKARTAKGVSKNAAASQTALQKARKANLKRTDTRESLKALDSVPQKRLEKIQLKAVRMPVIHQQYEKPKRQVTASALTSMPPEEIVDLQSQYIQLFDFDWYKRRYSDAPGSIHEAIVQLRNDIRAIGRNPNGFFLSSWYMEDNPELKDINVDPFLHFLSTAVDEGYRPHPLIDPKYIVQRHARLSSHLDIFKALMTGNEIDRTCEWFSRKYYLENNPDLVGIVDLENHFITHGASEKRNPSADYRVIADDGFMADAQLEDVVLTRWEWDGRKYLVIRNPVSNEVSSQIVEQGEFEPAIFAVGPNAIRSLRIFDASDLHTRDLVDYDALIREIDGPVDVVILLPRLAVGGGEKYASQLSRTLSKDLRLDVLVLITESEDDEYAEVLRNHALSGLRNHRIISFYRFARRTWKRPNVLALFLLALKPKFVFSVNSDTANAMYATYGRALSNFMNLFVTFFSESPSAIGAPFSAIYLSRVIEHVKVISDNAAALNHFALRLPTHMRNRLALLPQYCEFKNQKRRYRSLSNEVVKLLWVGRWEQFKNIDLVIGLALARSDVEIHLYSPSQPDSRAGNCRNIIYRGQIDDMERLFFDEYDAFLFTSQFEGMPNVVLEMALAGIPIISPKVGGLMETLSDRGIFIYQNNVENPATSVEDISSLIDRLKSMSSNEIQKRVAIARSEVLSRHSKPNFRAALSALLAGA